MTRSAKVMLLGSIGVGKTSLANRFVFDRFSGDYKTTIGVNILTHDVTPRGEDEALRLVLWDTDGDFGQTLFRTNYMLGASAAIVVADVTRPETISRMEALCDGFEERMPGRPIICVLNKTDLVATPTLQPRVDWPIVTTSALTGAGVEAAFDTLGAAILRHARQA